MLAFVRGGWVGGCMCARVRDWKEGQRALVLVLLLLALSREGEKCVRACVRLYVSAGVVGGVGE